jgi:hypothetical protein
MDIKNPVVKQLLTMKHWQLVVKATELKIPYWKNRKKKTKMQLALDIAMEMEIRETKAWKTISNGHS